VLLFVTAVSAAVFRAWPTALLLLLLLLLLLPPLPPRVVVADLAAAVSSRSSAWQLAGITMWSVPTSMSILQLLDALQTVWTRARNAPAADRPQNVLLSPSWKGSYGSRQGFLHHALVMPT